MNVNTQNGVILMNDSINKDVEKITSNNYP